MRGALVPDFRGDFETHLTLRADSDPGRLAAWARAHDLKFTHILLSQGRTASQPMLTYPGCGSLTEQRASARTWTDRLARDGYEVVRVKIEAAPWNADVPLTEEDAATLPTHCHFEHHVKLLLPDEETVRLVTKVAAEHRARVSRNARRPATGGGHERFVTQRCYKVGRQTARARLDMLLDGLGATGCPVLDVEEEFVVVDDNPAVDDGWFERSYHQMASSWRLFQGVPLARDEFTDGVPPTPARGTARFPATYLPVTHGTGATQAPIFDPALKQYDRAFRAGEPAFTDALTGQRWFHTRRLVMDHLLRVVSRSSWAEHLLLRGSRLLKAWLPEAREPGDLDFVVFPHKINPTSPWAESFFDQFVTAVAAAPILDRTIRLDTDDVAVDPIWTYERAEGRRLVIPWRAPGLPSGSVQLDFVFNEELRDRPVITRLAPFDGDAPIPLATASPGLSLAWKILWLASDSYPQGKDLYDAVLLAETYPLRLDLLRRVLRPELERGADDFDASAILALEVDWAEFVAEYPTIVGDADLWLRRLAEALAPTFRPRTVAR
ncbi:hypothetical protein C1701_10580 [Actinoalloteichus sp. AHMU CJ021]|nr:hypothetical protein C1701_10580 [Actinoalloteichus sp. AHMU CJ021]